MPSKFLLSVIVLISLYGCSEPQKSVASNDPSDSSPRMTYYAEPEYPRIALVAGIEGTVTLEVTVTYTDQVEDPHILVSSQHGSLDEAAMCAVPFCKWKPATLMGRPVTAKAQYQVVFRLP